MHSQLIFEINVFTIKVERVVAEVEDLANHGVMIDEPLIGLLEEQIKDLNLKDSFKETCIPSGGFDICNDPVERRNGRAPKDAMKELLMK